MGDFELLILCLCLLTGTHHSAGVCGPGDQTQGLPAQPTGLMVAMENS